MKRCASLLGAGWCCLLLSPVAQAQSSTPATAASLEAPTWREVAWHGENALRSDSQGWCAIVSLPRARLVHFGPATAESDASSTTNLLWAPATADDTAGWGGHRQWLGPQSTWDEGWPPPAAWERRAAEAVSITGARLALRLADAGHGWPRVVRIYQWRESEFVCDVALSGGTRPAQVVHIFQIAPDAITGVHAAPTADAPAGFVLLPSVGRAALTAIFDPLPHVTRNGDDLALRHLSIVAKLGFLPRPLTARSERGVLHVARGTEHGTILTRPDRGYLTQVYLGGGEPFSELEQLSPLFSPGETASFAATLAAEPAAPPAVVGP